MSVVSRGRRRPPIIESVGSDDVEVRRQVVAPHLIQDALRSLHIDLLERGASASELGEWLWGMHWFPHLRSDPRILALAAALPQEWRGGEFCEPQILLQFPHVGDEPEISYHRDQPPDWAAGRGYARIVGVPLSRWHGENGGLLVRSEAGPVPVELAPGDVVRMAADVWHSGGINRTGEIRYGVYFRWLVPEDDGAGRREDGRTTRG